MSSTIGVDFCACRSCSCSSQCRNCRFFCSLLVVVFIVDWQRWFAAASIHCKEVSIHDRYDDNLVKSRSLNLICCFCSCWTIFFVSSGTIFVFFVTPAREICDSNFTCSEFFLCILFNFNQGNTRKTIFKLHPCPFYVLFIQQKNVCVLCLHLNCVIMQTCDKLMN